MNTSRLILGLAIGLSVSLAPFAASAQERIPEEARSYFRNGVDLLQGEPPNYQDAYYQFKLAFEKSNSWKVLGNLGLCAVKLERDGEALSFYEDYLKRGGKNINKDEREAIERDVLLIRGNTGSVELSSNPEEAELQDVRVGSSVPSQTYAISPASKVLLLRAGSHSLTATTKDGRQLRWDVVLTPGKVTSHVFDFAAPIAAPAAEPAPAAPASAPTGAPLPPEPVAAASSSAPLRTVGFVAAGVGVALLGGGAVTAVMQSNKESDADKLCDEVTRVCDPKAEGLLEDAKSLARTTNILLVSGGAVTLVGIGLIVFGGPGSASPSAQGSFHVTPLLGGNFGGFVASGKF